MGNAADKLTITNEQVLLALLSLREELEHLLHGRRRLAASDVGVLRREVQELLDHIGRARLEIAALMPSRRREDGAAAAAGEAGGVR